MAATYSYYYTVETWLNWNDILSDERITDVSSLEGYNNGFPDWIQVHRESESTTAKKWTVEKGSQLQYRIRFYLKVAGDTATPANNGIWWLRDNIVDNVKVVSTYSAKLNIGKVNTDHHTFKPTTIYSPPSTTIAKNTNGDTFWFTIDAKQDSFTMASPFTITADIVNDNQVGGDVSNATKHATLKGINPTIVVSKAVQTPATPQVLIDALTGSGTYVTNKNLNHTIGLPGDAYTGTLVGSFTKAYDSCNKKWIGLNISPNYSRTSKPGKTFYRFTKITCGTNGTDIKISATEEETKVPGKIDGPKLLAARKEVVAALVANCTAATSSGNNNNNSDNSVDVPTVPPTADLRWNPPTHKLSRSLPFGVKMESLLAANDVVRTNGPDITVAKAQYYENMLRKTERGRIFQDALGASILNQNPDKLKLKGDSGPKQWGFRFMYNPTSFSYSSASNNSVDWTLGSSDPTVLLTGNANVTVELYINRIADMAYLRQLLSGENLPLSTMTDVYGRDLQPEEIRGLMNRGTEYDIEFLYRVLNGDPLKNPLLFDPLYDGVTSDFGYTTGVPCWMYLNENLRYYGSVASFQVNHVMFDLHMVPMLSVVSINFARYPALWGSNTEVGKTKQGANVDNIGQKYIADTGNTA
jgi:hypothetical protein